MCQMGSILAFFRSFVIWLMCTLNRFGELPCPRLTPLLVLICFEICPFVYLMQILNCVIKLALILLNILVHFLR
jgi:hypothetical protein